MPRAYPIQGESQALERFGCNVRHLRRQAGVSQEGLAVRSGIHWSRISKLELGKAGAPRLETILRLAASLDAGLDKLVGGIVWDWEPQQRSDTDARFRVS